METVVKGEYGRLMKEMGREWKDWLKVPAMEVTESQRRVISKKYNEYMKGTLYAFLHLDISLLFRGCSIQAS